MQIFGFIRPVQSPTASGHVCFQCIELLSPRARTYFVSAPKTYHAQQAVVRNSLFSVYSARAGWFSLSEEQSFCQLDYFAGKRTVCACYRSVIAFNP